MIKFVCVLFDIKFRFYDTQLCSLSFEMTMIIALSIFSICLTNRAASRCFCSFNFESRSFILLIKNNNVFSKKKCNKQMIIIMSRSLYKYTNKHCLKSLQKYIILLSKKHFFYVAHVKQNTINDQYIVFSLHKNLVLKYQFCCF